MYVHILNRIAMGINYLAIYYRRVVFRRSWALALEAYCGEEKQKDEGIF
jgi:hypothetical protein